MQIHGHLVIKSLLFAVNEILKLSKVFSRNFTQKISRPIITPGIATHNQQTYVSAYKRPF